MTLTSTTNRVQYDGDGTTVAFPVTFVFWEADDLQVVKTDAAGAETVWTRGTQYTVAGGDGLTGTVTVSFDPVDHRPASGETLTIRSFLGETQGTSLPLGGPLPSAAIEQQLDKIVRMQQQKTEELGRAFKVPVSESGIGELPTVAQRAGRYLAFDGDGAPLAAAPPEGGNLVSPFIAGLLDDEDAAAAQATLGISNVPADGSVSTAKLADGAVATAKLAAAGVTLAKLEDAARAYDIVFIAGFDGDSVKEDLVLNKVYLEMIVTRAFSVTGELGVVDTAPTGAALVFDILRNGTTIYSAKPQFAIGATTRTAGTLNGAQSFAAGDKLQVKVTQVGSTEPGEGLRGALLGKLV